MLFDVKQASDAELVSRFAAGRDQRAFAEVVRRHGPMVMGVAVRVLGNRHDAEDAFQATFLALACAADKLRRKAAVAAWLHQTVVRSARSIRRINARWKRNAEEQAQSTQEAYVHVRHEELRETLDAELARLPEKLRAAIVLCDLEGLSRTRAAERLGITPSTLANHVADGRKRLRSRLVKRGIGLSVAGLVTHLAEFAAASPRYSTSLIAATTTKASLFAAGKSAAEAGVSTIVAHIAHGASRAMTITKLTTIAAGALVLVFSAGFVGTVAEMLGTTAQAETIYFDNFDDGDARDGTPVTWDFGPSFEGTLDASSGDLTIAPGQAYAVVVGVLDLNLQDVSVRTQARAFGPTERLDVIEFYARASIVTGDAYVAGLTEDGLAFIRHTGLGQLIHLDEAFTDLRPLDEDVVMQFDVLGNSLSFWAWRPGERRPDEPLLNVEDSFITQPGVVGIGYVNAFAPAANPGQAVLRYVHVADASIPEPPTAMLSALFFAGVFAWKWHRWCQ